MVRKQQGDSHGVSLYFRACRQRIRSQRYIQLICTAAVYDEVFFAYLVAIPQPTFLFQKCVLYMQVVNLSMENQYAESK